MQKIVLVHNGLAMRSFEINNQKQNLMTQREQELEAEVKRLKEQLRIGIVSGRFNSDTNEENKKVLTTILYEHTDEKEMKIREVDYEEVVKDIMSYL